MAYARLVRHYSVGYAPDREEHFTHCSVCGATLDADRTQSPEETAQTVVITGTNWHPALVNGVRDLSTKDRVVFTQNAAYAGCWFCHSPRFWDGDGPQGGKFT